VSVIYGPSVTRLCNIHILTIVDLGGHGGARPWAAVGGCAAIAIVAAIAGPASGRPSWRVVSSTDRGLIAHTMQLPAPLALLLAWGLLTTARVAHCAAPPPLPNIFMYLADDAGWNDFGFTRGLLASKSSYLGPQSRTPAIDALAKGGIVLRSSYAYRYCSPSRAAFLTGRLPYHVHESNPGISVRGCTNLNYTMIPAKLKRARTPYTSFQIGKWHQVKASPLPPYTKPPLHKGDAIGRG
jgi:hypothetical protein